MPRYRVCVTISIRDYEHQTFVTADSRDEAENLAVSEAEQVVNSVFLDTSYDAWQIEECDKGDEERITAEDTDTETKR